MNTELKATALGNVVGMVSMAIVKDFLLAISVAAATGAAAYLGQLIMKQVVAYFKKLFKK